MIVAQTSGNGIKGDYEDITSNGTAGVDSFQTLSYKGGIVTDVMSEAHSYTMCFWVNTRDAANNGSESYIFNQFGTGTPRLKWRSDGRMQLMVNGTWYYADWNTMNSAGNWVFVALTVDSTSVKFFAGTKTTAVTAAGAATGLTVPPLPTLLGGTTTNVFVLNGSTYNGTDTYAGYDMDEFRVYSSKTNDSGALSLQTLEEIRQYDLGLLQ